MKVFRRTFSVSWMSVSLMALLTALLELNTRGLRRFDIDDFGYMLKGFQIAHGDWFPVLHIQNGWPAFLAGLYWLLGVEGFRTAELVSSITSALLSAATIPVAFLILRRYLTGLRLGMAMLTWIVVCLHYYPPWGMSEPITMLFLMLASSFLLRGPDAEMRTRDLVFAGLFGGLALTIRPPAGIFWACAILFLFLPKEEWKVRLRRIGILSGVYWAAAAPLLLHRTFSLGGPFTVGYVSWFARPTGGEYFREGILGQFLGMFSRESHFLHFDMRLIGVFFILALIAFPLLLWKKLRDEPLAAWSLLQVGSRFAFLILIFPTWQNFRYWTPYLFWILVPAFLLWERKRASFSKPALQLVPTAVLLVMIGWLGSGTFQMHWESRLNFSRGVDRIINCDWEEDPAYVDEDGLEIAGILKEKCRNTRIINIGAGGGSMGASIMRHLGMISYKPMHYWLESYDYRILMQEPDPTVKNLEDFLDQYREEFRVIIIKPGSTGSFSFFENITKSEETESFRLIQKTARGTYLYWIK